MKFKWAPKKRLLYSHQLGFFIDHVGYHKCGDSHLISCASGSSVGGLVALDLSIGLSNSSN